MEIQYQYSTDKWRDMFYNAPFGLIEISDSGEIININSLGETLLQFVRSVHGNIANIILLLKCISPGLFTKITNFKGNAGVIVNQDFCFRGNWQNAVERHFNITVTKMTIGFIVSLEDISERINKERLMQQSELDKAVAQGKFEIASEVLHDIGNAVVGFSSYLTRVNRTLENHDFKTLENVALFIKNREKDFAIIIGEEKAAALVSVLDGVAKAQAFSKNEMQRSITEQMGILSHIQEVLSIQRQYVTGIDAQERSPVNLKSVVEDCLAMLFATYDKMEIKVATDIPSEIKPLINGDRTKLMQVILNILKNSIEALDNTLTEKRITVTLRSTENLIELAVTDNGKGFETSEVSRVFDRGYTTKSTGSGLGLHNCKVIVQNHSGTISIKSGGINRGSTVTIQFKK